MQQRQADRERETYELIHPRTLTHEQIVDAVTACVSHLPHPKFMRPAYAISVEKYGAGGNKRNFIHVPGHVHVEIEKLIQRKISGVVIVKIPPEDDLVRNTPWPEAAELGMKGFRTPLNIDKPEQLATSIDAHFNGLGDDEALVLQAVVIPGRHYNASDAGEKAKFSGHTLYAVIRLAATGTKARSNLLNLQGAFRSTNVTGSHFHKRLMRGVGKRVNRRAGTSGYPILLNVREFCGFISWMPSKGGLPPAAVIPEAGLVLATSNIVKSRPLAMPFSRLPYHSWIIGPTGSGKSALLHNQVQQFAEAGLGFTVIEPKGDLCRDILSTIPENRINDVIYFNPTDEAWPIGLNILDGPDPWRVTLHVLELFHKKYRESWGPRLEYFLKLGLYTAAVNGLTIFEVKELMRNPAWRAKYVRRLEDKNIQRDWGDVDASGDVAIHSIINKIDAFTSNPLLRNIVGQAKGLKMRDVILGKKILLVPLDTVAMGEANAQIVGEMLIDQLWMAARSIPEQYRLIHPNVIDEFQEFAEGNEAAGEMLAMARSYKLPFIAAHQYTEQLERKNKAILPALMNNASTKIVFGLRPRDAKIMAPYFVPLSDEGLEELPEFGVAMRIMTEQGLAPTVTGTTFAPPGAIPGRADEVIRASRSNYAKSKTDVEAEINARYPDPVERKKPRVVRLEGSDDAE